MNNYPPAFYTNIFNTTAFKSSNFLTREEADYLYLNISYNQYFGIHGTAEADKCLILDSNKDITGLNNVSLTGGNAHLTISGSAGGLDLTGNNCVLNITGTNSHLVLTHNEASTSSTTGTIKNSGGLYCGNSCLIENGTLTLKNTTDSLIINNTSTTGRANIKFINDLSSYTEFGLRGSSTGSYSNSTYLYTNGSYKLILDNPTGNIQILSSTNSTGYNNGSLVLSGGVGITKDLNINGSITTNSIVTINGPGLYLQNGITKTGLVSIQNTTSQNDITIQSQVTSGVYGVLSIGANGMIYQKSNQSPGSSASCPLDFGLTAQDCIINLYGNSYFMGANSNALILASGGSNGIYMCTGGSSVVSGNLAQFTTSGSFQTSASIRACGFSSSGFASWSGSGLELHYSGGYGQIYAYNRSTLLYRGVYLGNEIYISGGNTSIGIGAVQSSWRLEVGTNTQNVSSYGYLNSGGSVGTSGSSGSVAFSAYFQGRIAVQGEIDVLSDIRLKSNIRDITDDEALNFVKKCSPKHYIFKNDELQYGYIAQDIAKVGLDTLIVCRQEKGLDEKIDDDGFVSPKDTIFSVSYQKIPALLHKYILIQEKQIKKNEEEIKNLQDRLNKLETFINSLDIEEV